MALADSVVFGFCLVITLVLVAVMFHYAMVLHLKIQFDQMGALLFSAWADARLEEETILRVTERLERLGLQEVSIERWTEEERHLLLTGNIAESYRRNLFEPQTRERSFRFYRVLPVAD
jgi:hypothetical protein